MARRRLPQLWATLFAAQTLFVGAVEVRFERVAENVYAHVGDIGARSVNEGLSSADVEQCRLAEGPEPDAELLHAGVETALERLLQGRHPAVLTGSCGSG